MICNFFLIRHLYIIGGAYYRLLRVNGQFMNVSAPEWNFPEINPLEMIMNQVNISSSAAGSTQEMQEMLVSHYI